MQKRYGILTVGFSHSGKSTFAKQLSSEVDTLIHLERDPVGAFLNNEFTKLAKIDHQSRDWGGKGGLKNTLFDVILQNAIDAKDYHIIISNCNLNKKTREELIGKLKATGCHIILVSFDIPLHILEERIRTAGKPTDVLTHSNSFEENLEKQKNKFDVPTLEEGDVFFTIHSEEDVEEVKQKVINLLISEDM